MPTDAEEGERQNEKLAANLRAQEVKQYAHQYRRWCPNFPPFDKDVPNHAEAVFEYRNDAAINHKENSKQSYTECLEKLHVMGQHSSVETLIDDRKGRMVKKAVDPLKEAPFS